MQIYGLNKTTLLDYPKHVASTIFLAGCNMRCPFCHNASLVNAVPTESILSESEMYSFLRKRKGVLEGVCITGGEPTLYRELPAFIREIKALGFKVKLDTNGTNPLMLSALNSEKLIDYVAMDIKNSKEKYSISAGIHNLNLHLIEDSIQFLLSSEIDYEFRTTIVREHHTEQDILSIGQWIRGAKAYYLQSYENSEDILAPGLHSHTKETLISFRDTIAPYVEYVALRGVN